MFNREKYRLLCKQHEEIPLFSKAWWLDAVAGENGWDVAIVEKNGDIIAALPYVKKKKLAWTILTLPPLTQNSFLWVKYPPNQKYERRLSYEKEIMFQLIESLPRCHLFNLNFHHSMTNWLPFFWRGFSQTTRYTYIIDNLSDLDHIYTEFHNTVRKNIRKAEKSVEVVTDQDLEKFYHINKLTFDRQGRKIPYPFELVQRLDEACGVRNCRKIYFAKDDQERIHAAVYIVWDERTAYYLMGGADPKLRNSGAMTLLLWEAMKDVSRTVEKFDFEGSMMEPIERFFRSFGAKQVPYFKVYKFYSVPLAIGYTLKGVIK